MKQLLLKTFLEVISKFTLLMLLFLILTVLVKSIVCLAGWFDGFGFCCILMIIFYFCLYINKK